MSNIALSVEEYAASARTFVPSPIPDMADAIKTAEAHAPGLTLTQLLVFLTIAAEEGLRLNELGARIDESAANVSRSVAALTAAGRAGSAGFGYGLATLLRDQDDGRARRVALSDTGRRLAGLIESMLREDRRRDERVQT